MNKKLGIIGAIWGVLGLSALLLWAIYRLSFYALEASSVPWAWWHWAFFAVWMVFMIYSEGYKGFQKGFSPRVVARAVHLSRHPVGWHVALAPLYCMGFIHATKKRRIVAFSVTGGVLVLVLLVGLLPQPWHGIVDFGVVAGLLYGVVAIIAFALRAIRGRPIDSPTDVPIAPGQAG
ncbi:hypothetical protein P8631_06715 [Guyparkeria sp. 1SP6A2]|nr:hypothetical protein [Guyparkeria sp. 1SP6A2]